MKWISNNKISKNNSSTYDIGEDDPKYWRVEREEKIQHRAKFALKAKIKMRRNMRCDEE